MRVLVFGGTGKIGRALVAEARARGHDVSIARPPGAGSVEPGPELAGVPVVPADVLDTAAVRSAAGGAQVVISAVGPRLGADDADVVVRAARSLCAAVDGLPVRLVVVGGAGSLRVAPGVDFVDSPDFPSFARPTSLAARDALEVYRAQASGVDWLMVCPPALIGDGARTGRYQRGGDELLRGGDGQSRISRADFAVAVLEEVEEPRASRRRITVAEP